MEGYSLTIDELRIPGDAVTTKSQVIASRKPSLFLLNDLLVQQDVTPSISAAVKTTLDRLKVDANSGQFFVFSSPHFQAECHLIDSERFAVRISSSLIEALDENELMFVIGHEIGHFLLGHLFDKREFDEENLEERILSRRRELSVDRIGLVACRSLDVALSAMMKTMSGLSPKHLKINVAGLVSQLRSLDQQSGALYSVMSTHPSFVIRCRALLWFSMNGGFQQDSEKIEKNQLEKINKVIVADLERYIDKPVLERISEIEQEFEFWFMAAAVAKSGSFSKGAQEIFVNRFGDELTVKLKTLLGSLNSSEAILECTNRFEAAQHSFERIAPRRYVLSEREVSDSVQKLLSDSFVARK